MRLTSSLAILAILVASTLAAHGDTVYSSFGPGQTYDGSTGGYDIGTVLDIEDSNSAFGAFEVNGTAYGTYATPEPSSLILFGTGVVGLAGMARRKLLPFVGKKSRKRKEKPSVR